MSSYLRIKNTHTQTIKLLLIGALSAHVDGALASLLQQADKLEHGAIFESHFYTGPVGQATFCRGFGI